MVIYSCTALAVVANANEGRRSIRMQGSNWALNVLREFLAGETDSGHKGMEQPAAPITVHFVSVSEAQPETLCSSHRVISQKFLIPLQ